MHTTRRRVLPAGLVALIAFGGAGCQNVSKLDLSDLGRESWQRPDDVVAALDLAEGDSVADIGAGEGYFLARLSEAVGASGRVYGVEVDAELIAALEATATQENVIVVLGEFDDPMLPDGEIDRVLLVNTYHHIEDRTAYFERLRADLSPRGRVAVIEPNADLGGILSWFLSDGHESSRDDVVAEMRTAGYRSVGSHDFLPVQIFEVFAPEPPVE